jgi:general stress protein CsbA
MSICYTLSMQHTQPSSPLVKWSLIAGIIIVMNLFFNYALSLLYTAPDYSRYVSESAYLLAQNHYDKNIFIALLLLGIVSLIAGSLLDNEVLSISFSWVGVLSLFIASVRYWSDANNLLKVVILAIALGSLIWIAIKKFG